MAPHRLRSRLDLRKEAAGYTPPTFRFWLIARTPTVLIDYLLEVLAAVVGLVLGPAFLSGFIASQVASKLNPMVIHGLGIVLVAGGLIVIGGLHLQKYGTAVPAGMFLLAGAFAAYAIAVFSYTEIRVGLLTLLLLTGFAALTAWKGFLLRSTFVLVSSRGPRADRKD